MPVGRCVPASCSATARGAGGTWLPWAWASGTVAAWLLLLAVWATVATESVSASAAAAAVTCQPLGPAV
eukprot:6373724-Lingulodinium_polyedra.AAC.1